MSSFTFDVCECANIAAFNEYTLFLNILKKYDIYIQR